MPSQDEQDAGFAQMMRSHGLPQSAIDQILRIRSVAICPASSGFIGALLDGKLTGADHARASLLMATLEKLDAGQRKEASRLLDSCSCVAKPSKLGTSIWRAREMFGESHAEFCAMALDARLLRGPGERNAGDDLTPDEAACLRMLAKAARAAAPILLSGAACRPCFKPDPAVLDILIEQGFPLDAPGLNESTPLLLAARQYIGSGLRVGEASARCAFSLLAAGCDPAIKSGRGNDQSPLEGAAACSNAAVALVLIHAGCNPFETPELEASLLMIQSLNPLLMALREKLDLMATPEGRVPASMPRSL